MCWATPALGALSGSTILSRPTTRIDPCARHCNWQLAPSGASCLRALEQEPPETKEGEPSAEQIGAGETAEVESPRFVVWIVAQLRTVLPWTSDILPVWNPETVSERTERKLHRYFLRALESAREYEHALHANAVVADRLEGTLELFEPWGHAPWTAANVEQLEQMTAHIPWLRGFRVVQPLDFCPAIGPQILSRDAFCGYWSMLYALMRAGCPDVPPDALATFFSRLSREQLLSWMQHLHCFLRAALPAEEEEESGEGESEEEAE